MDCVSAWVRGTGAVRWDQSINQSGGRGIKQVTNQWFGLRSCSGEVRNDLKKFTQILIVFPISSLSSSTHNFTFSHPPPLRSSLLSTVFPPFIQPTNHAPRTIDTPPPYTTCPSPAAAASPMPCGARTPSPYDRSLRPAPGTRFESRGKAVNKIRRCSLTVISGPPPATYSRSLLCSHVASPVIHTYVPPTNRLHLFSFPPQPANRPADSPPVTCFQPYVSGNRWQQPTTTLPDAPLASQPAGHSDHCRRRVGHAKRDQQSQ